VRQMLAGSSAEAEDVLQEVFIRAHAGLRATCRELSVRPWLYRIAHNRCVDELRRPGPPVLEPLELAPSLARDPVVESEQRESLRRLIVDIRRLPDQQRSALLMRELSGMAYRDIAGVLDLSVPAVKSLLVRARIGLAAALEARDTACQEIRTALAAAHDRGVRPSGLARRHLHDCSGCRDYRSELRGVSRQLAALTPAMGPLGALARLLGVESGGGAAAGGTGSGVAAFGGTASAGGTFIGAATSHVAAVVAAAVVTAGGGVEVQQTLAAHLAPARAHHIKRAATVGQATSAEGTVAATAAAAVAPLFSSGPAYAQQAPVPPGIANRSHGRRIQPHSAASTANPTAASAQASDPSQLSSDAAGTQPAGASADAGSKPPVCQSTTTPPQGTTTPRPTTSTCSSSATKTGSGGPPASTSPGSSAGSDPSAAGAGTTSKLIGSVTGSGGPSGTASTMPAQKT
jgi:RNA polymerase sigma factor (sigma-70 family)